MESPPSSVPSGANSTTPAPSPTGVLNQTEYLPGVITEATISTFIRGELSQIKMAIAWRAGVIRHEQLQDEGHPLRGSSGLPHPATAITTTGNATAASSVPSATAPDTGFTSR
ncbi:hypothetical protein ACVIIW_000827 [Bradyrhizobium sp. USDA 4449]